MKLQFLNQVEHIVPKGELAHHEQLLLLPQCFKKSSAAGASECFCMCKTFIIMYNMLTLNEILESFLLGILGPSVFVIESLYLEEDIIYSNQSPTNIF